MTQNSRDQSTARRDGSASGARGRPRGGGADPDARVTGRARRRTTRDVPAMDENVEAVKAWEQSLHSGRSPSEHLSDWITGAVASGPVLAAHVVWFAGWVLINAGWIPAVAPFDPFPFPFLTMAVSLEAIFLALFVLASQNRLSRQSDKRAHLDLQVDLLAEREMTALLRLLSDVASHLGVRGTLTPEQIADLASKTDIHSLTEKVDDLPAPPGSGG